MMIWFNACCNDKLSPVGSSVAGLAESDHAIGFKSSWTNHQTSQQQFGQVRQGTYDDTE